MVWREDGCVSGSARRCEEVEPVTSSGTSVCVN